MLDASLIIRSAIRAARSARPYGWMAGSGIGAGRLRAGESDQPADGMIFDFLDDLADRMTGLFRSSPDEPDHTAKAAGPDSPAEFEADDDDR